MTRRVKVPISKARTSLFHLTDLVRKSGGDTVVLIEQRGGREPVAMVRESRLAYLEQRVVQLEKRLQRDGAVEVGRWPRRHEEGAVGAPRGCRVL